MTEFPADSAALRFKILNWIGIIAQLSGTLANQKLAPLGLSFTQFVFLTHMTFRGQHGLKITEIARALQAPQPGVSKTAQKLLDRKLLRAEPNPADGRSKIIHLTAAGAAIQEAAVAELGAMAALPFEGIPVDRLESMIQDLDRLKRWFDDHRQPA